MKTEIIWTALPNGMEDGKLKLSVFVSHRLYVSSATLKSGAYADVLEWGSKNFAFTVLLNGKAVAGEVVRKSKAVKGLWEALIVGDIPVKAFEDKTAKLANIANIQTLSTAHLAAMVEGAYQIALETSPVGKLPAKAWMEQHLAPFQVVEPPRSANPSKPIVPQGPLDPQAPVPSPQLRQALEGKLQAWRIQGKQLSLDQEGFKTVAFEAVKFHEPFKTATLTLAKPKLDYHEILTALSAYPELMRALGLVFDLEVPIPAAMAATGTVEVRASYTKEASTVDRFMKTAYMAAPAKKQFMARPRPGSDIVDGMLAVGGEGYFLTQIDLDGATLKLANLAANFAGEARKKRNASESAALPSLRSAGISLNRSDRAKLVKARLTLAANLKNEDAVLYYDDVVRGYRVDVNDRGVWRSLCGRTGVCKVKALSVDENTEGWVSTALTSAPEDVDGAGPKRLHECLWTWSGWSLAVERPGKHLDEEGKLADEPSQLHEQVKLEVDLMVPKGSLPTLRFGRKYKLRARAVDLAGNSLPVSAPSSGIQETESIVYSRFDPVLAPGMYPTAPVGYGESENHIVIRKFKKSPDAVKETKRIVVPPEGGVSLAEQHGKFDTPEGRPDPEAYQKVIAPHDNADPLEPIVKGPLSDMPYLVDPAVRGIRVHCLATEPGEQTPQEETVYAVFPGEWPKIGSAMLVVAPAVGTSRPKPLASGSTVTVPLRPGEVIDAEISSTTNETPASQIGVLNWRPVLTQPTIKPISSKFLSLSHSAETVKRVASPTWTKVNTPAFANLKTAVTEGKVWLVTPDRGFTMVYATQIPESDAVFEPGFVFRRDPGSTSLRLGGRTVFAAATQECVLKTHAWSTDEVEAWAVYTDDLDLPEEKTRKTKTRTVQGTAFKVLIGRNEFSKRPNVQHEIGDTKHHEISYTLKAHSRFRKYFDPSWDESEFIREGKPFSVHVPSTARPASLPVHSVIPTFGWSMEVKPGGIVSRRQGDGLRVYVHRPWFSSGNGEKLGVVLPVGEVSANSPLYKYVTLFGADPIYGGGKLPSVPTAAHFKGAEASGTLTLAEVPGASVAVASYPVEFDEERQLWYADLLIEPGGGAYFPFVKLALARYQQHSLSGLELGPVAAADFMQLAPDRSASLVWEGPQTFRVSVSGVRSSGSSPGRIVIGSIEERTGRGAEGVWVPTVVDGKELEQVVPFAGLALALGTNEAGRFTLPASRDSKEYRLVIREYEVFPADTYDESEDTGAMTLMALKPKTNRRLVYLDVIPLSGRA